ncbi:hypothetical protein [Ligilactobacillus apodemi]|uniref:Uncharacterized protein n=1 Tax=Ligilactobacillus apodemi DSM 16634 = JCM 16172 TaxID=1423724 RepID=A0A0R1TRC6_9LACO|nr:hypothetical protein [Ligilactobacillus apodemi]KRL83438.1 hypothetical protein FC32_GL000692 [Ligilactobacillus apodemi DSM 16634 = JCM 16172]
MRKNKYAWDSPYIVIWLCFGILLAGGGLANVVMNLVGDRRGVIYGLLALSPLLIAIFLFVKYRKWAMRYLLKELKEHGVLIEKNTSDENMTNKKGEISWKRVMKHQDVQKYCGQMRIIWQS